jgi:hypothetical protein
MFEMYNSIGACCNVYTCSSENKKILQDNSLYVWIILRMKAYRFLFTDSLP